MLADGIWDAAGVDRAPYAIVPADRDALAAATRALAGPLGAVWSGDTREGFNGGGDYVRWVRDDDDQARALAFFLPRCDRVRVMPFLDGVPCSIHGLVLPDGTAALPPGRDLDPARRGRAHLPRTAACRRSGTRPPPTARRCAARSHRVGEHLRATLRLPRRVRHRRRAHRRRVPADRAQRPRLGRLHAGDPGRPQAVLACSRTRWCSARTRACGSPTSRRCCR